MKHTNLLKSDGHLTDEAIYLYNDALKLERAEELPADVRAHVQDCLECKRSIFEIYNITDFHEYTSLGRHPYFDQKKTFFKPSRRIITRIAAGIIIGFGLVFLAYLYYPTGDTPIAIDDPPLEEPVEPTPPDTIAPEDIPPAPREVPDPAELYAANFEPSPFYENLVDQPLRSHIVRIQTPQPDDKITNDVYFSWESYVPITVHLHILDNRDHVIWSTTTDKQSIIYSDDPAPGIYYWRLETDEELLYVGKFIVPVRS